MKKLGILAALGICLAGTAIADPVEGTWQTEVDDGGYGHVKIVPCGEQICGTLVRSFTEAGEVNSPDNGKQIIWDMQVKGGGAYGGGKILNPKMGKVFKSKMTLQGDLLKVSGCVGPICKKQNWRRVK
ncbi:DUF2147 domain-containing protein [Actibacterium sp. D379-3]